VREILARRLVVSEKHKLDANKTAVIDHFQRNGGLELSKELIDMAARTRKWRYHDNTPSTNELKLHNNFT
jgi:hypothetical protein